jgi:hypothetical protein
MMAVHRAVRTLDAVYAIVGVHPYDQGIPQSPGFGQKLNMAQMKDVETAVCEYNFLILESPQGQLPLKLIPGKDLGFYNFKLFHSQTD